MTDSCVHLKELIDAEIPALEDAIEENKYFLSERAGHDVGIDAAKKDFYENHFERWAREFKCKYCENTCPEGAYCTVNENLRQ